MGPGDVMIAFIVIGLPVMFLAYLIRRWFAYKEKQLEVSAHADAERAAEYAASNKELEQRVRVLEQIVTDGGLQTAAQIEALRGRPRLQQKDELQ